MLTSAAVVPAAPLLVPEVARGAAGELDGCRQAIDAALASLLAQAPDVVVLVGAGERTMRHGEGAEGSLRPVGVDVCVSLGRPPPVPGRSAPLPPTSPSSLPLSLALGAWLLRRAGWAGRVVGLEVAVSAAPQVCLGVGVGLAEDRSRTALLVVADGTARRGPAAPGYTDERAEVFDRGWLAALGHADAESLAVLDPALADDLMMTGRAPLQVLAGASRDRAWAGEVLYADDPYGVQYAVARWLPAGDAADG